MKSQWLVTLAIIAILLVVGAASVFASAQLLGGLPGSSGIPLPAQAQGGPNNPQPQGQGGPAGVLVAGVVPDGPADRAGILPGERIVSVNGQAVNSPQEVQRLVAVHKAGDVLRLGVLAGGAQREVEVTAATAPNPPENQPDATPRGWIGVMYAALPGAPQPGNPQNPNGGDNGQPGAPAPGVPALFLNESGADHGIALLGITAGSPADKAGLRPGDVIVRLNGNENFAPRALPDLLRSAKAGDVLDLSVARAGSTVDVKVSLGEHGYLGVYLFSPVR